MGVETAPVNKGKGPASQTAGKGAAATGPNSSKNAPANPPVRQFANQLQQDIEDVTVEVNTNSILIFKFLWTSLESPAIASLAFTNRP